MENGKATSKKLTPGRALVLYLFAVAAGVTIIIGHQNAKKMIATGDPSYSIFDERGEKKKILCAWKINGHIYCLTP